MTGKIEQANQVCKQFSQAKVNEITPLGNGLINDTFLIKTDSLQFVLQRINEQVFPYPALIMENLLLLNQHTHYQRSQRVKLKIPAVIKTHLQQAYYLDQNKHCWRAMEFIPNSQSKEEIEHQSDAQKIGSALAHFHLLFATVDIALLHDTLPGFHITPEYFRHFQQVENKDKKIKRCKKRQFCDSFIEQFKEKIEILEQAKEKGLLTERITHGDPKLNNFLFDRTTGDIVSLIDLDTVKPGLVHYDIADCVRSCCHNEQTDSFNLELCRLILDSYLHEASIFLTDQDYHFLYPAIEMIPFELGLRFLTDYLKGSQYFKVDYPEHNLERAVAQFKLCQDISRQEVEIKKIISTRSNINSCKFPL